jgi:hypothetical protein
VSALIIKKFKRNQTERLNGVLYQLHSPAMQKRLNLLASYYQNARQMRSLFENVYESIPPHQLEYRIFLAFVEHQPNLVNSLGS